MNQPTVADRRLHPATFAIRGIRALPQYALGFPAAIGVASGSSFWGVIALVGVGLVAALGGAWLYWRRFRYGVGSSELVIESGIFQRQRRVIPFNRIQDIDIEQGMLARLFGTAKVRIETGAAAKNEGDLDSVALSDAHGLRALLRSGASDTLASAVAAAPEEPLLFQMDVPRLLLAGLFNFSLFYIAFLFGALQYVDALFGFDPFDLDWVAPTRGALVATGHAWLVSMLAAAALVVIGIVAGLLRTIARDYDFRLSRAPRGLRRRRGLFTLSEVVIPFRRVQLVMLKSGLIGRALGWHRLELQTLNADAAKSGHQVAVPLGTLDEIHTVLAAVHAAALPLPEPDAYHRVSKRHILRQSLRSALFLALVLGAAAIATPEALLLLLVLPFAVGAAALQWRHHRYLIANGMLYVRAGILKRRTWIVPCEKVQVIGVTRGPLQRLLGLASVSVDTAGALALNGLTVVNLPEAGARIFAAQLLAAHKDAREALRTAKGKI